MNSHAVITLALLFIFFVPSKGGAINDITVTPTSWTGAYTSQSSVKIGFKATGNIVAGEIITIEFPGGFKFSTPGCSSSGTNAMDGTFAVAVSGQTVTITRSGGSTFTGGTAGELTLTNIKFPAPYVPSAPGRTAYFKMKTGTIPDTGQIEYMGLPLIYFLRSECKVGGLSGSATVACDNSENPCQHCTGDNGFVTSSGLQTAITSCDNSIAAANHRCDSMYYTENSMDVAVNTNGNHGTLTCGAFLATYSGPPTINFMQEPNNIKAKNSVFVPISDRYSDHVVTLFNLDSHTQYELYCHMDNVAYISPKFEGVWTGENDRIWGDSFLPGSYVEGASPGYFTLTFSHGKAISNTNSDIISLIAKQGDGSTIIWATSPLPTCTLTSDGTVFTATVSLASPAGGTANSEMKFTLASSQTSGAGSQVVITCSANNFVVNPNVGANGNVQYELSVTNHPQSLTKRFGWTTIAS